MQTTTADRRDSFNGPPPNQEDRIMNNNYEAAEVVMVGNARDTILGIKTLESPDNRVDVDMTHRDDLQLFDE
jgi:hypothetical protein